MSYAPLESLILLPWAQLFENPISANPRLNFNLGFFIPLFKSLFSDNFRPSF